MPKQDKGSRRPSARLLPGILKEKRCKRCGKTKKVDFFSRLAKSMHGLSFYCNDCNSDRGKESYSKRKEACSIYGKEYRKKHSSRIKKQKADRYLKVIKPRYQENKDHINRTRCKRIAIRIKEDLGYKIECRYRSRIGIALRKNLNPKKGKTIELLGCSIPELKEHLEKQFKPGMCWGNHSHKGWHMDHIKPCAAFDLSKKKQQHECFHYTNLQPLWAEDNLKKKDKYSGD